MSTPAPRTEPRLERRREHAILRGVILIGVLLLATYAWNFRGSALSPLPEHWGQFGDFLGGVLNPICALATVVLLVQNLWDTRRLAERAREAARDESEQARSEAAEQTRQLRDQVAIMERSARAADIHRKLEGVLSHWFRLVQRPYVGDLGPGARLGKDDGIAIEELLGRRGEPWSHVERALGAGEAARYERAWRAELGDLEPVLDELADYCDEYDALAGSRVLTEYYRHRVADAARCLRELGLLSAHTAQRLSVDRRRHSERERETATA